MYRGKPIPREAAIKQRLEKFFGTAVFCEDSIQSQGDALMAERMESDGTSVTRIPEIGGEAIKNNTVNRDLMRELDAFCEKNGIEPENLSDEQIKLVIGKEVRRRMLAGVNEDNFSGPFAKLPTDMKKRCWNGGYNWDGESLMLREEFERIDQSDPDEPRPTPKKTRKARKSSPQIKVTCVDYTPKGGMEIALATLKNEPVAIVHIDDPAEKRLVSVEGSIDPETIDLAVSAGLTHEGFSGHQEYQMVHTITRSVLLDPGPDVDAVRKALQGSAEGDEDSDAEVSTTADEPSPDEPPTKKYTVGEVELDPPGEDFEKDPEDQI